ncbi:HupE/UreJ family protein [Candidatus Albibeggiatoa sp. nov. NOAA]|uniref:HupE/UreJ family protein n=1 Tax=Candidatus Albibeggiatoa sp. nov. NOAA TaxID=3162724 RepID=UPI0032FBE2C4|nr:HupE/UreJ family protein [Thiotrichaceae bacterium]
MLSIVKQSRWLLAVLIASFASLALGHGMSEAEKQIIIEGGNLRYIWIGATHMLSGYDHLAFVFGIIFFLTKFRNIVKYITTFTVGHSITLIFATFNAIQINYFLIDAVIALSVCYIAFHNLDGFKKYLNIKAPNMLVMIFSLGLVHGLGLSTRLQQLPLNPDQLLMNIISFNIGIELGQISALAAMLLLIAAFRKSHHFPIFSKISNYLLIFAGAFLFLMQMHGYVHTAHADEFVTTSAAISQDSKEIQQSNWKDTISITIPAREDKEYKLQLANSALLNYEWQTEKGKLFFDFHGEPQADTTGSFKTFEKGTKSYANGSLTTTFTGTHGWYWKNNNAFPVVITLKVSGEYQRLDIEPSQDLKLKPTHDTID